MRYVGRRPGFVQGESSVTGLGVREFSLGIEESCPTVRVQRMRKQVGLSPPWGPSLHQP